MRFLLRRLLDLLLLLVLTAALVTASAVWFALHPPRGTAETIVLLAGGMAGDRLGSDTEARVRAGVALYQARRAPRLHFSGAGPGDASPSAAERMQALAVSLGVPAEATTVEGGSHSTLQNALLSRPVLGPRVDRPVILVSDGYHLARAWASFRLAGYPDVACAAATAFGAEPLPGQLRSVGREALAWWLNLARAGAYRLAGLVGLSDAARIDLLR
jgi:uncharacterized SAM-binding protein YcdF (DUF218 family)